MASFEENAETIGDILYALPRVLGDSSSGTVAGPFADSRGLVDPRFFLNPGILDDANGASGLSCVLYIRPDNVTDTGNSIVRGQFNASTTNLYIRHQQDDLRIGGRSQSGDTFQNTTVTTVLTAATWIFVGLSLDFANDEIIYRIGTTTSTDSVTFGSSTGVFSSMSDFNLGFLDDASEEFNGAIAHFYLFDKALTAANLTTLYNSTSGYPVAANPPTTPDTTKVLTWNPDSNSSNISYTNGNLTANYDAVSGNVFYFAKFTQAYAKSFIYFEVSASDPSPDAISVIVGVTTTKTGQSWIGNGSDDVAINSGRALYVGGSSQGTDTNLPVFAYNTHRVCCAVDIAGEKVWIGYVNISTGVATYHGGGNPATDTTPSYTNSNWGTNGEEFIFPAVTPYGVGNALTIHYAESDFVGSVPSGFYALQYAAEAGGSMIVHPGMNGGING